jgi:hypothetical protein
MASQGTGIAEKFKALRPIMFARKFRWLTESGVHAFLLIRTDLPVHSTNSARKQSSASVMQRFAFTCFIWTWPNECSRGLR